MKSKKPQPIQNEFTQESWKALDDQELTQVVGGSGVISGALVISIPNTFAGVGTSPKPFG